MIINQYVKWWIRYINVWTGFCWSLCINVCFQPPYGFYYLMDEQKVTDDEILLQRMGRCWSGHASFSTLDHISPKCFQWVHEGGQNFDSWINSSAFHRIRHFAGTLNYSTDNFVEKNSDKIPKHLSSGLYQSKLAIVQNLFPEGNDESLFHFPSFYWI